MLASEKVDFQHGVSGGIGLGVTCDVSGLGVIEGRWSVNSASFAKLRVRLSALHVLPCAEATRVAVCAMPLSNFV